MTVLSRIGGIPERTPRETTDKIFTCIESIGVYQTYSFHDEAFTGDKQGEDGGFGEIDSLNFKENLFPKY